MRQTLFLIPYDIGEVPLFGAGLLLAIWAALSIGLLAWLVRRQGFGRDTLGYLPVLLLIGAGIFFLPRIFPHGLPVRGYGVMLLLAVSSGVGLAAHRARRMGVDPELIFSLAFWMFIAGILGARLFHVIEYWDRSYKKETLGQTLRAIMDVPSGGLVVYGSLIGALIAFIWFARSHRLNPLALGDLIAPSMVLGLALGRIGCLLNGCCFGGACDYAWAVTFPQGSPPYMDQVEQGRMYGLVLGQNADRRPVIARVLPESLAARTGLESGDRIVKVDGRVVGSLGEVQGPLVQHYLNQKELILETESAGRVVLTAPPVAARSGPVHPTQIYSATNALLLCLFLLAYYPFRRRDGEVLALMLTIYPISRYLIEIIRTDEAAMFGTGLSISQIVSLLLGLGIVGLWFRILRGPLGSALPPRVAKHLT